MQQTDPHERSFAYVSSIGRNPALTSPYAQPGSNIVFGTLVGLFALGEYTMRFRSRANRSGRRVERASLPVVVVAVVGGMVAGIGLTNWKAATIDQFQYPLFIVGLVLMAAGFVVRQWAIVVLGRFFTVDVRVHPDQTVVDRGPYRWVRHPSYTGLIIFFFGFGLALSNWASFAVLALAPTLGLLVRIRAEERALFSELGDEYSRYAATRRRLFPGVW
jgi:protein-S-isoprenylcysteine O-methyltransferase Ste14